MPILDPNEINNTVAEPVLGHRFIMYIDGIPSYFIKAVNGIGFDDGEVIIDHINTYFKTRAKRRWNDINLSLYNFVAPSGAQLVMEWGRLGYEVVTGRAGYADFYWKDVRFNVLSPVGELVSEWIVQKAYIKNFNGGDYDYSNDAFVSLQLTLGCSGMVLNY